MHSYYLKKVITGLGFLLLIIYLPMILNAECIKGNCQNGKGTFVISPKSIYSGDFKEGKYHGRGTCTFPNGAKYVGQWRDGKMNGKGVYTLSKKSRYVGDFKDGMFHGYGTLYSEDGKVVYKGKWVNDRPVNKK
ncbi:MAG: hypothetical protein KBE27_05910 [Syntrophorhabdaceae bacterium]|nr:hypothetical protein [Syntrophorhabdales bacterium]MBP9561332.1 hypothetical protein [Syntrophorhabdaceae bacterium]